MLVPPDPVRAQVAHGGEAEGEVQRRQQHVDAKGRPAVLAGQFPQALGEGEGGRGGVEAGGRVVGSFGGLGRVGPSWGVGGEWGSARGACEEVVIVVVGEGAAGGAAGQEVEEGGRLLWWGEGCCVVEGLLEGGAEGWGITEELEGLHDWWAVVMRVRVQRRSSAAGS